MDTGAFIGGIEQAVQRIYTVARRTPCDRSAYLSGRCGAEVWLKLENLQYTGSFKLRGAANRLMTMDADQRARGCVVASSGNHGIACAHAMARLGIDGEIFVPENVNPAKVEAIRLQGGRVSVRGRESGETERLAREHAARSGMTYVSPYNDVDVVCGQGTVGYELLLTLPAVDTVFVAVGGGGLIGGIGAWLKHHRPQVRIIGCLPENSAVMARSVAAGHVVDLECRPTLSDGTAGNMDHDAITFPLCRALVDRYVEVSEAEIAAALRLAIDHEHMLMEGAAGVALAGLLKCANDETGTTRAVVICGANIDSATLHRALGD